MGLESMRRWPMYIVFAACIILLLSLINSWGVETELTNKLSEIMKECSKKQSTCLEESLTLIEQRDKYASELKEVKNEKDRLNDDVSSIQIKAGNLESKVNTTVLRMKNCQTELDSLKNLQMSTSATLEAVRLKSEQLSKQLEERNKRIEMLEKEMESLRSSSIKNVSLKMTPPAVAEPPKLSPAISAEAKIEPVLENNAKEDFEDNLDNKMDVNDFD